jgi:hypothetical protein
MLDWLTTPEAQASDHYWLSVLVAHAAVGAAMLAVLAPLCARLGMLPLIGGLQLTALIYALWEAVQTLAFGGALGDALVDWVAVVAGALAAAGAWAQRGRLVAVGVAAVALVAVGGMGRRK